MNNIENKKILITGGLGFIGFNTAKRLIHKNQICIIDNCSRVGVEKNIPILLSMGAIYYRCDVSRIGELKKVFEEFKPEIIIHLAAQVAVTLSVTNPKRDFKSNLIGSFNILELSRIMSSPPIILYASTNKVYGNCGGGEHIVGDRYVSALADGISEGEQLSFETPYGVSKGAADQYFLDYAKTYGLRTVVFRQSCIYGPNQFGMEDQGWVAWFAICNRLGKALTIFGDGNQVRDVLYVDDLIDLYELAVVNIESARGHAFNIGGGAKNSLSINELVKYLDSHSLRKTIISYANWRTSDQKIFVCNTSKAKEKLGWIPKTSPEEGLSKLITWIEDEIIEVKKLIEYQNHVKQSFEVSIVIPARNEEACLGSVLDEISGMIKEYGLNWEFIVVNDRSTDKTVEIAKKYSFVKVVDSRHPPGKGGALRTGFEVCNGEFIGMMDADFSHIPYDLPLLLDEVQVSKGLCIGSRQTGGSEEYTKIRTFGNVFLTWFFGFIHGRNMSDILNGFKLFHRDIFTKFEYQSISFDIEIELVVNALRLNREICEIPSRERERMGGSAKSRVIRHGWKFFWRILREGFASPRWINGK